LQWFPIAPAPNPEPPAVQPTAQIPIIKREAFVQPQPVPQSTTIIPKATAIIDAKASVAMDSAALPSYLTQKETPQIELYVL